MRPCKSRRTTSPEFRSLISNCILPLVSFVGLLWHASLGHSHDHTDFGVAGVVYAIHERSHVKDTAAGRIEQVVWIEWIRKTGGIKAFTVISYGHTQSINTDGEPDFDGPLWIVFISVLNRVGD